MSIYFGSDTVNDLYIGLTPVTKGYVGTHLFYNGDNTIIDLTYEKYILNTKYNTLYNTEEAPVKSAILKGNTLVNINRPITRNDNMKVENGLQILTPWTTAYNLWMVNDITLFKTNTKYYIIVEVIDNTLTSTWSPMVGSADCVFSGSIPSLNFASKETGIKCATFTTKSDFTNVICGLRSATGTNETVGSILKFRIIIIEYQDGMEKLDIPYFEGMQSVKTPVITTTGKNLFNVETVTKGHTLSGDTGLETPNAKRYVSDFIYVKGITHLAITNPGRTQNIWGYDENKQPIRKITNTTTYEDFVLSVPSDISYIRLPVSTNNQDVITDTIIQNNLLQVEAGQQFTTYEPFKTNILAVNEPVKLLGIGEVKDELDLLTGELTQRIGDITFDGSENWKLLASNSNDYRTVFIISRGNIPTAANIVCAEYSSYSKLQGTEEYGYIYVGGSNLNIVEGANMSLDAFKSKLQSNPVNIQYLLPSESVKTVDLSVTNQDGNVTKLSTFNDITHVELSSDGMIPEAELEVATKNEEVLNTMSLEMDGISTTQTTLEETSNIQSENVDSTMIATTEIYEQLL